MTLAGSCNGLTVNYCWHGRLDLLHKAAQSGWPRIFKGLARPGDPEDQGGQWAKQPKRMLQTPTIGAQKRKNFVYRSWSKNDKFYEQARFLWAHKYSESSKISPAEDAHVP